MPKEPIIKSNAFYEANKVALESLRKFSQSQDVRVISIEGAWGIGKTCFFNNKDNHIYFTHNHDVQYVSLFGVQSIKEVRNRIAFGAVATEENFGLLESLFKDVKDKLGRTYNVVNAIDGITIKLLLKKIMSKRGVIIFDDIERMSPQLELSTFLGFVDRLINESKVQIIFISNPGALYKDAQRIWEKYNEKVVRLTVKLTSNSKVALEIISSLISKYFGQNNDAYKAIQESIEALNLSNIRLIKLILRDIYVLSKTVIDKTFFNEVIPHMVVSSFLYHQYPKNFDFVINMFDKGRIPFRTTDRTLLYIQKRLYPLIEKILPFRYYSIRTNFLNIYKEFLEKNALNFIEYSELCDRYKIAKVNYYLYQEWKNIIDRLRSPIVSLRSSIDKICNLDISNFSADELIYREYQLNGFRNKRLLSVFLKKCYALEKIKDLDIYMRKKEMKPSHFRSQLDQYFASVYVPQVMSEDQLLDMLTYLVNNNLCKSDHDRILDFAFLKDISIDAIVTFLKNDVSNYAKLSKYLQMQKIQLPIPNRICSLCASDELLSFEDQFAKPYLISSLHSKAKNKLGQ